MNRITPEMVIEAYNATKLLPHKGRYFFFNPHKDWRCEGACPLAAVKARRENETIYTLKNERSNYFDICTELGISHEYRDGFTDGVDCPPHTTATSRRQELENARLKYGIPPKREDLWDEYTLGFTDGRACAKAVELI